MAGVVEFKPSRALEDAAGKMRRPRKRKKRVPTSADNDPRAKVENRTFEVAQIYVMGDGVVERRVRIRVKKMGLEDNVFEVGERQCYCGLVSEQLPGRDKWSPYAWGHVPVVSDNGWVREIIDNDKPPVEPVHKDEAKDDR